MQKSWWNQNSILLPVLIALIFLVLVFTFYPFRQTLQFDTDEGLNLMRSMLVEMGYPLYNEVFSDQPPLFNEILALVFHVTGFQVNAARLLVLLFSTLLVWAGAQFLQLTRGNLAAILFLPLILMVPHYLDLSVAVMIGLPSITLAVVSMLFVTIWHQKKNSFWLVLSGYLLALSVFIKLFIGFLAPIFVIGITVSAYLENNKQLSWRLFQPAFVWGVSFAGLAALLAMVLVSPGNLSLIVSPHVMAGSLEHFQTQRYSLRFHLQAAVPLLLLAFPGALLIVYKKIWLMLYPLTWSLAAYLIFSSYSPVFYHHQLLITVPAAMVAAAAVEEGIFSLVGMRRVSDLRRIPTLLAVGAVLGFVLVSIHYAPVLKGAFFHPPLVNSFNLKATAGKLEVLSTMKKHIDRTNWIVTDLPMYAFRLGRPVPPPLATFSYKQLSTGSLTEEEILSVMGEYKPEQVLTGRFQIPALEEYLQQNYTEILSVEYFHLFLRNDLAQPFQE